MAGGRAPLFALLTLPAPVLHLAWLIASKQAWKQHSVAWCVHARNSLQGLFVVFLFFDKQTRHLILNIIAFGSVQFRKPKHFVAARLIARVPEGEIPVCVSPLQVALCDHCAHTAELRGTTLSCY